MDFLAGSRYFGGQAGIFPAAIDFRFFDAGGHFARRGSGAGIEARGDHAKGFSVDTRTQLLGPDIARIAFESVAAETTSLGARVMGSEFSTIVRA